MNLRSPVWKALVAHHEHGGGSYDTIAPCPWTRDVVSMARRAYDVALSTQERRWLRLLADIRMEEN